MPDDKCPKCGADVDERRTWDARSLRGRGESVEDYWVWGCGRVSWIDKDTLDCLRRQLADQGMKHLVEKEYTIARHTQFIDGLKAKLATAQAIIDKLFCLVREACDLANDNQAIQAWHYLTSLLDDATKAAAEAAKETSDDQ